VSFGLGGGKEIPSAHACAPATINTKPNAKPHKTFFITPSQCQVGTASASAERCHVLQKPVFIPEFGTRNDRPCISPGIGVYYLCMFTTAREDFERCTLNSVPGILGKLEYLAQLREENGRYFHWGLARLHGEEAAGASLEESHLSQFLALLRTPLPQLWDEIQQAAEIHQVKAEEYVRELQRVAQLMIPPATGGGSQRHFNSVLQALSALVAPVAAPPRRAA
jgi:hypothetical protein